MININDSECTCGNCGSKLEITWEITDASTSEKENGMGPDTVYYCEGSGVCPDCGNVITAEMTFEEYPEGSIEIEPEITDVSETDNDTDNQSIVEAPDLLIDDM